MGAPVWPGQYPPLVHRVALMLPIGQKVVAGHVRGAAMPRSGHANPGVQGVQSVGDAAPGVARNVPAGQGVAMMVPPAQ